MNNKILSRAKRINYIKTIVTSTLVVTLVTPSFNQIYALNNDHKNHVVSKDTNKESSNESISEDNQVSVKQEKN